MSLVDNDETDAPPPPPPPPVAPPAPQCGDGIDNDLDGKIDFPAEPGCQTVLDNDETDPLLPPPPVCSDGADNDGDRTIDYAGDPGCASPSDMDETDPPAATGSSSPSPSLLSPFPIVRMAGRVLTSGVRVTLLTVQAPRGSLITIMCRDSRKSCPRSTTRRTSTGSRVRIRSFERRLRSGTVLRIFVTRAGTVGKYTRFTIRSRRAPTRADSCARRVGSLVACP